MNSERYQHRHLKDPTVDFTILKYPNRKLYNKQTASYMNYTDLSNLIQRGATVKVIENRTGADITAYSLVTLYMKIVKPDLMNRTIDELRVIVKNAEAKKVEEARALADEKAAFIRKLLDLESSNASGL